VVAARRFINAACARFGGDWDLASYDVEDAAWDLAAEGRDEEVLEAQRQEALDELCEDEDSGGREQPGNDPRVIAVHARYDLACQLGEVLRELHEVDEGDVDEIVADLRDRLSDEGETIKGAKRALKRTVARYRAVVALRVAVETYGRLVKKHVSAWPPADRDAEEAAVRAIVFGEE
jgi:hypothetical protein